MSADRNAAIGSFPSYAFPDPWLSQPADANATLEDNVAPLSARESDLLQSLVKVEAEIEAKRATIMSDFE